MAVLWQYSLVPWTDSSGDPYSGAKAYFFDVGTTTPQIVYTDAALSIPHDHPVLADSGGKFPAVFFPDETSHRLRILTSADVTIHDVDNISVPTTTPPDIPDSDTPVEKIFQTGDIKMAWRTSSPTGWVRVNGRTIGSAASGATERANADCEDLFTFLWTNDDDLTVSGGRGANAAADWAADKTIALPDFRGRVPAGLDSMGNSAAGRLTDSVFGVDTDTLGSAGGDEEHTLVDDELPSITPEFTGEAMAAHGHPWRFGRGDADISNNTGGLVLVTDNNANQAAFTGTPSATLGEQIGGESAGTPAGTISSFGSDDPHNNTQPTILLTYFIKL